MASYNRVILMGNITRDIDMRYTQGGLAVAKVGLAVNERRKNAQGEWIDEPCYVDVTMFGRTAEIASEYLSKGSPIFVEGRLKFDSWEKDGHKHTKLSVVCDRLQFIGPKGEGSGGKPRSNTNSNFESSTSSAGSVEESDVGAYQDQDIPF